MTFCYEELILRSKHFMRGNKRTTRILTRLSKVRLPYTAGRNVFYTYERVRISYAHKAQVVKGCDGCEYHGL